MPRLLYSLICSLLTFAVIAPLLVSAVPVEASSPGDPTSLFDAPRDNDKSIHVIDNALFDTFKFISQYAAAAYCPGNNNSPNTTLTCPRGNCPLVEAAGAVTLSEFEDTPKFDDTGYIAIDDTNKIIVLAIRGSVSDTNWRADWDMIRVQVNFCDNCKIHRGFRNSWEEIKIAVLVNIQKAVQLHPDYRIIVTGHSLGGAVATLAAAELRRLDGHFLAETELYTFGSPRIANDVAAEWLSGQSRFSWRITNENDIVPRLPPHILGYHHTEPEYWIYDHGDNPSRVDIQWRNWESFGDWGNEGELIPSRKAHHHYFGDISACSPDNGDWAGFPSSSNEW
ncbi:MAG: hypothetical protein Q9200_006875 [Gallowayella weberi]